MRKRRIRRWTAEEDAQVLEHGIHDTFLSDKINRTIFAIQKRRSRLLEVGNRMQNEKMKQYMESKELGPVKVKKIWKHYRKL